MPETFSDGASPTSYAKPYSDISLTSGVNFISRQSQPTGDSAWLIGHMKVGGLENDEQSTIRMISCMLILRLPFHEVESVFETLKDAWGFYSKEATCQSLGVLSNVMGSAHITNSIRPPILADD